MSIFRQAGWTRNVLTAWGERLPVNAGGYAESVSKDWKEEMSTVRTLVTQARLAYVFTLASRLSDTRSMKMADEKLVKIALAANHRLASVFWQPGLKGWVRSVDADGKTLDATLDSYEQSFGFLALAGDFLFRNNDESKNLAREALAGLTEYAASPSGGYLEYRAGGKPSATALAGVRRQDPHMHLFEAFTAWIPLDPQGPWKASACALLKLFREKFRKAGKGPVFAYFDDAWNPAAGDAGKICVPGDQYEWAWLLYRYEKATGDSSVKEDAQSLYEFAEKHGIDTDGAAFSAVSETGEILDAGKLFWPQTEKLKCQLALYNWTGKSEMLAAAEKTLSFIEKKFMDEEGVFFCNKLEKDGSPSPAPTFSRLLYHFFFAASGAEEVLGFD